MAACDGPLAGLLVVEIASGLAGPYCGQLLAQASARVVKIEPPSDGDTARTTEPSAGGAPDPLATGLFTYLNRGKESLSLNLSAATGQELAQRLLCSADVLLTDLSSQGLRGRGLAIPALLAARLRLVITTITPWGADGALAELGGPDLILFHGGGLGAITPRFANNPADPPLRLGAPLAEFVTGLTAAVATLHAVGLAREGGEGQHVDVSGQQAIAFATGFYATYPSYEHRAVSRVSRPGLAPYHFLPCSDGWVMLICPEEHQWRKFVRLMGDPEWADSPVFATVALRAQNWDALEPSITEWTRQRTRDELYRAAQAARVPLAAVDMVDSLLRSEHLAARGFFQSLPGSERAVRMPGSPVRSTDAPPRPLGSAPRLGEHTAAVLTQELGLQAASLPDLRHAGII